MIEVIPATPAEAAALASVDLNPDDGDVLRAFRVGMRVGRERGLGCPATGPTVAYEHACDPGEASA
ncbi:hypothetical protein [Pseudonocardia acidicola]|uniref:Uncharacterized protein n=1 Tax=Pseudonocardia acidicola TaxID=2724939 RepID=A0ABX1SCY7_9PSEU|nr:hypothetical protein [Pseudonocardia acidicola]NMH98119.1 hypothetical protein [Pseudonocardia acidicola]